METGVRFLFYEIYENGFVKVVNVQRNEKPNLRISKEFLDEVSHFLWFLGVKLPAVHLFVSIFDIITK